MSIQGLYRFYDRRTDNVVASWMTRQHRELAIADNATYVARVLKEVLDGRSADVMIFAGFSQGVSTAFRAAVSATGPKRYVIAVGGDVPPELGSAELRSLLSVLICRGAEDQWYDEDMFNADVDRLRAAGVAVQAVVVAGGHEWSQEVNETAGRFLREHVASTRA